jgi:hypothetical protein
MSDDVGVQPGRLSELASALEQLRDTLAQNVPTIVSQMNSYWSAGQGTAINLSSLQHAQGQSVEDAAEIRARSNLAIAWEAKATACLPGDMISVPWPASGKALDAASAQADAQLLAQAEAEAAKDPKAARAQIAQVEDDLQDHLDQGQAGSAWVTSFYNDSAPSVANLAATLHTLEQANTRSDIQDQFTVLSAQDQKVVATFANGLAQADRTGNLTPQAVNAIANAPDAWSAAMLVKFGPPGSRWATSEPKGPDNPDQLSLLALLTNHVYEQEQKGLLRVPLGDGDQYDAYQRGQLANVLSEYDPLQAMMQADAQNGNAASQVMSGTYGAPIAKMLLNSVNGDLPTLDGRFVQGPVNSDGKYAGYFTLLPPGKAVPEYDTGQVLLNTPDQNIVGEFLTAAISAPRVHDTQAQQAAQAAVNIINNLPSADDGMMVSAPVQGALEHLLTTYRWDVAFSAFEVSSDNGPAVPTSYGSVYGIQLSSRTERNLLLQALQTGKAYGTFLGQVRGDIGTAAVIDVKTGESQALDYESALAGLLQRAQNKLNFDNAEQAAAVAAENQEMAGILQGGLGVALGFIPGGGAVGAVIDVAEMANALSGPAVSSSLASSTDPAQVLQDGDDAFYDMKSSVWIPIANAMVASKIVPPPPAGQNLGTWVAQQLTQSVQAADAAQVSQLNAELANTALSQQQRTNIADQIDKLNAQIGGAGNLYDDLINRAENGMDHQQ